MQLCSRQTNKYMTETWKIFKINDCDWYVARSLDEATAAALKDYDGDESMLEEPHELSETEMAEKQFRIGEEDDWECSCGFRYNSQTDAGNPEVRFDGDRYEHSHGYPIGHIPMRRTISFTEQLKRYVSGDPVVGLFASTEA